MTDYSRKRCVVCNRTGGITLQSEGIYECRNCGTPYRPRGSRRKTETTTDTSLKSAPTEDRFVWFTHTDEDGVERTGLYDCPVMSEHERPNLELDENKLGFIRHLYKTGRMTKE